MRPGLPGVLKIAWLLWIVLFCIRVPAFAQQTAAPKPGPTRGHTSATLRDAIFRSANLNREMHYRVLLPTNYDASVERYPTLFLLHGLYGDYKNWSTLTSLANYARNLNLIIAMPDAGNSWYVNSASDPADKYENYIVQDFIKEIDTHYRTMPQRATRAVAGLSMGGYAAVKLALKYPNLFAYAGGISAALDASADLDATRPEFRDGLRKVFGEPGNPVRAQNDVFVLLDKAELKDLPYFYLDCGSDDSFLGVDRKFVGRLQKLKIRYEYYELPGGHDWKYWDSAIERFLGVLGRHEFAHWAMRAGPARELKPRP
jgi:putative tributyrin esterase